MRRPESADSRTARVAMDGARGAAVNMGRAESTIMAVLAGTSFLRGLVAGSLREVQGRLVCGGLGTEMSPPPNAGQLLTVLTGSSQAVAYSIRRHGLATGHSGRERKLPIGSFDLKALLAPRQQLTAATPRHNPIDEPLRNVPLRFLYACDYATSNTTAEAIRPTKHPTWLPPSSSST